MKECVAYQIYRPYFMFRLDQDALFVRFENDIVVKVYEYAI